MNSTISADLVVELEVLLGDSALIRKLVEGMMVLVE